MTVNASAKTAKRFRIWPGVVFPAGLTLLLALAGWQFVTSVTAEQERRNDADMALASYARMEAGELTRRAAALAESFTATRRAARAEQERNLRTEIRGVMEAVNRVLVATLEQAPAQPAQRREVAGFPSGFEGIRRYLELSRPESGADRAVQALHACAPELDGLLPAGCSLSVVENGAVEIFSLGGGAGGAPGEDSLSVAMNRDFVWSDGAGEGRHWTLLLKLHAPDLHPVPLAAEVAEHLSGEMTSATLNNAVWRGWLLAANGQPAATFPAQPAQAANPSVPAFPGMSGEWTESDTSLTWLEAAPRAPEPDLTPAVAVTIPRPPPPLDLAEEFFADARWLCTLGALALGALGFWVWFARNIFAARHRPALPDADADPLPAAPRARPETKIREAHASAARAAGAEAVAAELLRRKLVRAETPRAVADVESVIVADIHENGGMTVSGAPSLGDALRAPAPQQRAPVILPSGSLFRLQAQHRGGKGRQGSRALDRATHPVLKTLAARIRPVVAQSAPPASPPAPKQQTRPQESRQESRPRGRVTERYVKE